MNKGGKKDFTEKDYIDKMLVDKFSNIYTINPNYYQKEYPQFLPNGEYCKNNEENNYECGCTYCRNYDYEEPEMTQEDTEKEENKEKDMTNPNCYYERLGVDILSVQIGQNLLPVFDECFDNIVQPKLIDLRKKLTDKYGYIIPRIRFMDSELVEPSSYTILIRNKEVFTGHINIEKTETADDIIKYSNYADILISDIERICMDYVHIIMTKTDALKLMELVRSQDPTLVNDLIPVFISAIDLKYILANLISKRVSIKDIIFIFELLNDYARYTQNIEELTQKLIQGLDFVQ